MTNQHSASSGGNTSDDVPGKKRCKVCHDKFYGKIYEENDTRIEDEKIAVLHLRIYESDEGVRWEVAEITAIQMMHYRHRGNSVTIAFIKKKAFFNWLNHLKRQRRYVALEALDKAKDRHKNGETVEGMYYHGRDAPQRKPRGPYTQPEAGAIVREYLTKGLSVTEKKQARLQAERLNDDEMGQILGRDGRNMPMARSRLSQKIRDYLEGPPAEG